MYFNFMSDGVSRDKCLIRTDMMREIIKKQQQLQSVFIVIHDLLLLLLIILSCH